MYVYHTVNAGLYFQSELCGLLVDALHGGSHGFSRTPENILEKIEGSTERFATEVHLAFTHLHDDHFNKNLVQHFMKTHPTAKMWVPETWMPDNCLNASLGKARFLTLGRFHLTAFSTIHDGKDFANVPHQSLMVQSAGQQFLICGDAILDIPLARHIQRECPGDIFAVFVNVYQLASEKGLAFLREIRPHSIFLYHLPFAENDTYSYRKIAASVISHLPEELRHTQLLKPMHTVFDCFKTV